MDAVPDVVLSAASRVKIAVIDSGADVSAPDLADKTPATWSVLSRSQRVRDVLGHGTFVSSLAAGSVDNGVGIAGFGGDAKLLVVQAIGKNGYITDVDEAAAIVYAVKHGAKIINLSIGGSATSLIEQRAVHYAARHGVHGFVEPRPDGLGVRPGHSGVSQAFRHPGGHEAPPRARVLNNPTRRLRSDLQPMTPTRSVYQLSEYHARPGIYSPNDSLRQLSPTAAHHGC